jgi:hypothetical protein
MHEAHGKKKPKNQYYRDVSPAELLTLRVTAATKLQNAKDSSPGFFFKATFQEPVLKQSNLFKNVRFLIVDFKKLLGFASWRS